MLSGVKPDIILSSPALRAQKSAEILANRMEYEKNIDYMEELYLSSADVIKNLLHLQHNELDRIMLVGHNPGLSDFAYRMTGGEVLKIAKGAVLALNFDIDEWSEIRDATASIEFFVHPRQFRYTRPSAGINRY